MESSEMIRGVEVRAIFPGGTADGEAEFVARALEALVDSVDPEGWVEMLHRCEGGFVPVTASPSDTPLPNNNGNDAGQGGGSDVPPERAEKPESTGDEREGADGNGAPAEASAWPCPWCEKVCASAGGLGSHKRTCPERPDDGDDGGGRSDDGNPEVDCPECGRTFGSRQALGGHMSAHNPKKPRTPNEQVFGTRDENVKGAKELSR